MFPIPTTLLVLFLSSSLVIAGDVHEGGACSVNNNKLQVGTYEFSSDCDSLTYCNQNTGKCEKKGCRRSEFPLGYPRGGQLPPRCEVGKFCPDEEDSCQDKLPVGSDCQLNRDGKTVSPPWVPFKIPILLFDQMNVNLHRTLRNSRINQAMA